MLNRVKTKCRKAGVVWMSQLLMVKSDFCRRPVRNGNGVSTKLCRPYPGRSFGSRYLAEAAEDERTRRS